MPKAAGAATDGQGTEFIFPPPVPGAPARALSDPILIAAVSVMAAMFIWACWNSARVRATDESLLAEIGLLGLCLAATGAAVGAMSRSRACRLGNGAACGNQRAAAPGAGFAAHHH